MAIQASTISSTQTLEEFRQEFNKLQSDVSTLESGPTFTSSIAFEGATADDYETTLTVTDPTADRTITLQNKSGTVALIGTDTLDTVKLNGTDASKTNAGDDVVLDGTDSSSTNAGDALLFEDATGDHLLNQVPFEEYFLLESSFFGSDGTQAKHFLLEQTDGDQIEVEFGTSDVTLGAAFRPPAGGGPQFRTPTNDGTNEQVLQTDGSGNLSFVDRAAGMTLSGTTNNTVVTVTGSNAGQGEGNLTFDGSILAVTGNVTATGTVEPAGDTATGDNAAIGYTSGEGLILTGQGSTSDITVKNEADGTVFTVPTGTDDILFPDSAKAMWGAGSDLQIYHDGSNSYISDQGTGFIVMNSGEVRINNVANDETMARFVADGATSLYYDNTAALATASGGGTLTGSWAVTTALNPDASDGAALGTASLEWSDLYLADAAKIYYGADQDIQMTHTHNTGLTVTNIGNADNTPMVLLLRSEEDDIVANEVIASLQFGAGDSSGTDAAEVAAGIHAIAEGTFSASANATKLVFTTAVSETAAASATAKMTLSSAGALTVVSTVTCTPTSTLLIKDSSGSTLKTVYGVASN